MFSVELIKKKCLLIFVTPTVICDAIHNRFIIIIIIIIINCSFPNIEVAYTTLHFVLVNTIPFFIVY
jgi:hypothetical protein